MLLREGAKLLRYEARVTRGYEGIAPVLLGPYPGSLMVRYTQVAR